MFSQKHKLPGNFSISSTNILEIPLFLIWQRPKHKHSFPAVVGAWSTDVLEIPACRGVYNTKHKPRKLQRAHKTVLSENASATGAMGKKKVSGTRAHSHSHRHEATESESDRERERESEGENENESEIERERERAIESERQTGANRRTPHSGHSRKTKANLAPKLRKQTLRKYILRN